MNRVLGGLVSLFAMGLRGLRSRTLLTLGSILLAAISIGAAVVGPMYQAGASASYLVTKLRSVPTNQKGLVFDYVPQKLGIAPKIHSQSPASSLQRASDVVSHRLDDQFGPATFELWTVRLAALGGQIRVISADGSCSHLLIAGRCPTRAGEALMLAYDSQKNHVAIGQTVQVDGMKDPLTIVGTYKVRPKDSDFWFSPSELESVPPQPSGLNTFTPYYPAPLIVTPETFAHGFVKHFPVGDWFVRATRRLIVTPHTTLADLQQATHEVGRIMHAQQAAGGPTFLPGRFSVESGNALVPISRQIQQRYATSRSSVAPAVVSVILVALVLLLRLLAAAMDLRRSELALASLRGFDSRRMWLLGLIEPVIMLAVATPIGVVGGYLVAKWLGRVWLVPELPLPLAVASVVAVVAVVVAVLVVAALVVRDAIAEPLGAQIAGIRRPARAGRLGMLLRLVLIAGAIAVLVATVAAGKQRSPSATDLALPILLAVAAGLVMTLGAQWLARWWARWSGRRRGVIGYVASRTISRRREGTIVILPLTAALAIGLFAAGVFTSAANWRGSDAATIVGAGKSYSTDLTLGQAIALTHRIDPKGRWLMAIGANYGKADETLVVDAPRLARVADWQSNWTPGVSAATIARELSPQRAPVTLKGSAVSMTIDNHVTGHYKSLYVDLSILLPSTQTTDVFLGPFPSGATTTTSAKLPGCVAGCVLQQIAFGGPAGLSEAMQGTASVTALTVDGRAVAGALDGSWRISSPILHTPVAVAKPPTVAGGRLTVAFSSKGSQSYAAITPNDVPRVRPVIMGRTARPAVAQQLSDGVLQLHTTAFVPLDVRPVATSESMPVLGPRGMMIDYTMLTRDVSLISSSTFVSILARSDTPTPVLNALANNGISRAVTLGETRHLLDQDAFALALNLYLVVTLVVILLAIAGLAANLAVQMAARRRDAASLRVVGLRRRSIIGAVLAEFVVVMGAAAIAGIGAGALAQYVVVRTVTLGYADSVHTPRLLPTLDLVNLSALLGVVAAALLAVAVVVATLTVRGARTASLRETVR